MFRSFSFRKRQAPGRGLLFLDGSEGSENREIVGSFIQTVLQHCGICAGEILLPLEPEEKEVLETWLSAKRGSRVYLMVPSRAT